MSFVRKMTRRSRGQHLLLASFRSIRERLRKIWMGELEPEQKPEQKPDWPRHEQFIHAAWNVFGGMQRQSLGYFLCDPPRFVPCPHLYAPRAAIGMKGIEEMCGSIPWEEIFFWAPFGGETEAER